jgi:uncharacterized protein YjbI with pentapeptide repeats
MLKATLIKGGKPMANEEHLALLKQGAVIWNRWRREHPEIQPDLCSTKALKVNLNNFDLSNFDLSGTILIAAELNGTNFSSANLSGAGLSRAKLRGANFTGTNLSGAYLGQADLSQANLCGADLRAANFTWATFGGTHFKEAKNLNKADFTSATFRYIDLSGANLSEASLDLTHFEQVDFRNANLRKANLCGAKLHEADLSGANLQGAFLSTANLCAARFSNANLAHAKLVAADLYGADFSDANLYAADLSRANAVWTNFTRATLTGCRVYGISAWNAQLEGTIQTNLILTPEDEPIIVVDDFEVAQFIYLLLSHHKRRHLFNAVLERGVLLLGHADAEGLEVLQAIADQLREAKYLPIVCDCDQSSDHNRGDTIKTLAGLSRFIIADLGEPLVLQELSATVPHVKVPCVPILEAGREPSSSVTDLLAYPWVVWPPVIFANTDELVRLVPLQIIAPAEEKYQARQQLLDAWFNPPDW